MTTNPDAPPGCGQLQSVRLPAWCLPPDWPRQGGELAAARIAWRHGVIEEVTPQEHADNVCRHLVLPAFVQTHAHLDKAFTIARTPSHGPGLLAAIEAVIAANPAKVEEVKAKPKLAAWFVGQVMKQTGGKANPAAVNAALKTRLNLPDEG